MKSRQLLTILLLLICISCTSNSTKESSPSNQARLLDSLNVPDDILALDSLMVITPLTQQLDTVKLQNELIVGEHYIPSIGAPFFGRGPKTAVDDAGRIYMADRHKKTIHVFEVSGDSITTIGREGRGPGEFRELSSIEIYNDTLIVFDGILLRLQQFSLNPLALIKTIKLESQTWNKFDEVSFKRPLMIYAQSDSTFVSGVVVKPEKERFYIGLYTLNSDAEALSSKQIELIGPANHKFTAPNGAAASISLPFSDKDIWDIDTNGKIYKASTGEFLIKIFEPDGSYYKAIYYPYDHDPLQKEEEVLSRYSTYLQKTFNKVDFPETWPALESMLVDDENRLWISTIVDDKEVYKWWIINTSGEVLAKFTWPRDQNIAIVKNGKMYVENRDREKGIKQVVRYDIKIEPSDG